MKAMGLDIGSVTVGIALSDSLKMIANAYTVIRYQEENEELIQKIIDIINQCCSIKPIILYHFIVN